MNHELYGADEERGVMVGVRDTDYWGKGPFPKNAPKGRKKVEVRAQRHSHCPQSKGAGIDLSNAGRKEAPRQKVWVRESQQARDATRLCVKT